MQGDRELVARLPSLLERLEQEDAARRRAGAPRRRSSMRTRSRSASPDASAQTATVQQQPRRTRSRSASPSARLRTTQSIETEPQDASQTPAMAARRRSLRPALFQGLDLPDKQPHPDIWARRQSLPTFGHVKKPSTSRRRARAPRREFVRDMRTHSRSASPNVSTQPATIQQQPRRTRSRSASPGARSRSKLQSRRQELFRGEPLYFKTPQREGVRTMSRAGPRRTRSRSASPSARSRSKQQPRRTQSRSASPSARSRSKLQSRRQELFRDEPLYSKTPQREGVRAMSRAGPRLTPLPQRLVRPLSQCDYSDTIEEELKRLREQCGIGRSSSCCVEIGDSNTVEKSRYALEHDVGFARTHSHTSGQKEEAALLREQSPWPWTYKCNNNEEYVQLGESRPTLDSEQALALLERQLPHAKNAAAYHGDGKNRMPRSRPVRERTPSISIPEAPELAVPQRKLRAELSHAGRGGGAEAKTDAILRSNLEKRELSTPALAGSVCQELSKAERGSGEGEAQPFVELSSSQERAKCQSSTRAHPSRTEGTHVRMPSEERPQPPKPQTARGGGAGSAAKGGVNVKEEVPLIDAAAVGDTERTISPWPGAADMTQHPKREETTQKITDTSSATPAEDSSMISPSTAVSSDEDHKLLRRRNVLVKPQVPSASHPPPLRQPVNRACGLLPATRRREGGLGSIEDVACVDSNKTEWATETHLGVTREGHSLENASSVLGKRLARVLGKHLKGPWEMHRAIHEKRVLHPRVYLSLARQQQEEETGEEGEEKEVEEASEVYILRCVLSPVADVNSEKSKTDHALPTTNDEIICMSPEAADSDSTGEEVPSSGVNVQFNCGGGGTLMANVATQRLIPALSPEKEKRKEREEGGQDSEEKDQQQHCSSAAEEEEATGAERGGLLLLQKEEEDEESFNQMLKELKPSKKSWASKLAKARLKLSCVGRFSTLFELKKMCEDSIELQRKADILLNDPIISRASSRAENRPIMSLIEGEGRLFMRLPSADDVFASSTEARTGWEAGSGKHTM